MYNSRRMQTRFLLQRKDTRNIPHCLLRSQVEIGRSLHVSTLVHKSNRTSPIHSRDGTRAGKVPQYWKFFPDQVHRYLSHRGYFENVPSTILQQRSDEHSPYARRCGYGINVPPLHRVRTALPLVQDTILTTYSTRSRFL
ncbi:uncharacterized protein H6S33_007571 [Morchella sextelata]|uniref:uncharacterized protein n=1 Tax=Morchella sextelata TaxID=1174677 RepID=UPI001D052280|nr:uncharacterized protein H6S33_007571 [Morchella sextelata]KAH0603912.1 hypothetical protein H6S33_007571 [Morchella sextelata]